MAGPSELELRRNERIYRSLRRNHMSDAEKAHLFSFKGDYARFEVELLRLAAKYKLRINLPRANEP